MGQIKILFGDQPACQGAAREASQEQNVAGLPAGQGPHQHGNWSQSSWARRTEQGQSRGHILRIVWQGCGDWGGLKPGWDISPMCGGQHQERRGKRLRDLPLRSGENKGEFSAPWLCNCIRLHPSPSPYKCVWGWVREEQHTRKALKYYAIASKGFSQTTRQHFQSERPKQLQKGTQLTFSLKYYTN